MVLKISQVVSDTKIAAFHRILKGKSMFGQWVITVINFRRMAINHWLLSSLYPQHIEEVKFSSINYHKVIMFSEESALDHHVVT